MEVPKSSSFIRPPKLSYAKEAGFRIPKFNSFRSFKARRNFPVYFPSFYFKNFYCTKTQWEGKVNPRPLLPKPFPQTYPAFPAKHQGYKVVDSQGRMISQAGPQGCLLPCQDSSGVRQLSKFSLEEPVLQVQLSPVRSLPGSCSFSGNSKSSYSPG